jgi:diguanylate cyclase (GGDEF)-like protein
VRRMLVGEIRTYQMEKRYFHKEGQVVWTLLSVSLVHDEEGEPLYFVSQIQDISERKDLEERLQHRAFHDFLTNLPNRQLFMDRLGQALRRSGRRHNRVAVLFMDLDGFKVVNDSLGHQVGDLILTVVAQRLRSCLRPEDTLARFGGDEFVVLIEAVDDPAQAVRVAERITEELRRPFIMEGRDLHVIASIGISLGDARTHDADDLLREADTAMYRAKDDGGNFRVFSPAMYERAFTRFEVENDLRRAIEQEEFVAHYQPMVDLRTGELWGMEALVRWDHPERGLLEPSEFVPVAEQSGLVIPMGEQILREACCRAKEWQEENPRIPPLVMSVNLSASQLSRSDLADTVERVLRETGLQGSRLTLDVTETVYVQVLAGNTAILDRLGGLGVRFSIDDFSTGYSSLSYLKRLPAHAIKIDQSFVEGIGKNVEDTAIVRMILELAHTLGLGVIAEGVETEEQAAVLKEMGCDFAQGYHFAKPLPAEAASR